MGLQEIYIKGARQHNLKNIDISLPREKLIVITGLSGSGKSSLAFDTLYAEGQRRYVESLSAYARQFLERMDKPDVDYIEGLSPAIAIEQKSASKNPRSTVGTVTEIYDYLRVLYARIGRPFCPNCGRPIASQSPQEIVKSLLTLKEGTKIILLAPIVKGRKGTHQNLFMQLLREGFTRVRVDGEIYRLEEDISLNKNQKHFIEVVIDRIVIGQGIRRRLTDSVELALKKSGGSIIVKVLEGDEILFSEHLACDYCNISLPDLTPQLFSFNSPQGACPKCGGLGTERRIDPNLIIPNKDLSIRDGAILPWANKNSIFFHELLEALCRRYDFDIFTPIRDLPKKVIDVILYGTGGDTIRFFYDWNGRRKYYDRPFEGIIPRLERLYVESGSTQVREEIERYMNVTPCPLCKGARLRKEALSILVGGKNIFEISSLSIAEMASFFDSLKLNKREELIAHRLLREIKERLHFMIDVGLDYLTLSRSAQTLSGGENQRIRLATQIGSRLTGVLYVLDEPTIGLHQRDNSRLLNTLERMRDIGNTVVVVEHDAETILRADHVVDLGPGAGREGGEVVFEGPPSKLLKDSRSLTGAYLSGKKSIPVPKHRRKPKGFIRIEGATTNNLKEINVDFPLGVFTCVTGVSGSGKSSLVMDTLYPVIAQRLYKSKVKVGKFKKIKGLDEIDKVIDINQSPIGRTPRSNPATYTGVFTHIRDLFAKLPESRARGYMPGRFSFNVPGGRCQACKGDGIIKIEMHFLPDVYVTCEECKGKRYNRDTLEITYKGKNISEVLDMTVREALDFFNAVPSIRRILSLLEDVGLGYIKLGQPATTLSGGEAQRIKLTKELSLRSTGRTLYILDEPTTGLHFEDILRLLTVLNRLVEMGNTVIVIEHNLEVIKCADYIIDLGPEGGDKGGEIVATGPPEEIIEAPNSYTGEYLKSVL